MGKKFKTSNYKISKTDEKFDQLPVDISDKKISEVLALLKEYAASHKNGAYARYMGVTITSKDSEEDAYRRILQI